MIHTPEFIDAFIHERIILVIGAKDTGKTTCIKELANAFHQQGYSVGIIDADVGQSDVGPPTTIGLGIVEQPFTDFQEVRVRHIYFVGSISPKGHLLQMVIGVRKMLDAALDAGIEKILIDTTGLVSGQLGRVLKEQKIQCVQPDVIVCLQHEQECEHILSPYRSFATPRILRRSPARECRNRSQTARQHHRERIFQAYFQDAPTRTCALTEIGIFESYLFRGIPAGEETLQQLTAEVQAEQPEGEHRILWGEFLGKELLLITNKRLTYYQIMRLKRENQHIDYIRNMTADEFEQILVGILDGHQNYCALGILQSLDFSTQQATIVTHAAPHDIAGITLSSYVMRNGQ